MTLLIEQYEELRKMQFESQKEFFAWRGQIIPFLSEKSTKGREFLYSLPFISNLIYGRETTKTMCRVVLQKILDQEMTERIKEIEKIRGKKE